MATISTGDEMNMTSSARICVYCKNIVIPISAIECVSTLIDPEKDLSVSSHGLEKALNVSQNENALANKILDD